MMKKAIKKLLAALLAVAMLCAMAVPALAATEDITNHSFSAFQIFKGNVEGSTLSNVEWGSSISATHDNFLEELKKDATIGTLFENADTLQKVLDVMKDWNTSDDRSIAFARFVCSYLYPNADAKPTPAATSTNSNTIDFSVAGAGAGYYLIVDTTGFNYTDPDKYHAYNSFLLNVTKAESITVKSKVEKPSVKKEVYDNNDIGSTGEGWGSSADHAINEPFQFKLTATVPASADKAYDYYNKYTVIFYDTLSEGITFDRLDKVEITNGDGSTPQLINDNKYTLYSDTSSFTLGIDDVKTCVNSIDLNQGATITVTYTAHLNEKAYANTGDGTTTTNNKNEVFLQYSNNPKNSEKYWGFTPKSEVYVFTYQLNNTKYRDEIKADNKLEGAGFRLYSDADCKNEVELYQEGNFYFPIKNATGKTAVQMLSNKDGQFNVKGLDAGIYYLMETSTPAGFNTCPPTTVTIKATHTGNKVELAEGSSLEYDIVNKSGTTLPSTGGIGTTIFYVVGGGLMVAAIVLLVTKKRMENK